MSNPRIRELCFSSLSSHCIISVPTVCVIFISVFRLNQVKHELNFHDKDTHFYRFLDSEFGQNHITNEKDSEEELQESLSLLSQLGPDALLTMILRKWSVCVYNSCNTRMMTILKTEMKTVQRRHGVVSPRSAPVRGVPRTWRSSTRSCSTWRLLLISPPQSVTNFPLNDLSNM